MGAQRRRTPFKHGKIHIPVGAVVVSVHKAGLRRCFHLCDKGTVCHGGKVLCGVVFKQRFRTGGDLLQAVGTASCAGGHGSAADDAAAHGGA